jgi:hypothetical protein
MAGRVEEGGGGVKRWSMAFPAEGSLGSTSTPNAHLLNFAVSDFEPLVIPPHHEFFSSLNFLAAARNPHTMQGMDTFANLHKVLDPFESAQFSALKAVSHLLPPLATHGGVQFVSIEPAIGAHGCPLPVTTSLPVVVGVGINYTQYSTSCPWKPSFPALTRFLQDSCTKLPTIVDSSKGMRSTLNYVLDAYHRNRLNWTSYSINGRTSHASTTISVTSTNPFILIATNLSPFITLDKWSALSPRDQAALRSAWPSSGHLNPLIKRIGKSVDLWVWHGKDYVWPEFSLWPGRHHYVNWLLTYNLSGFGARIMRRTKKNPTWQYYPLYR